MADAQPHPRPADDRPPTTQPARDDADAGADDAARRSRRADVPPTATAAAAATTQPRRVRRCASSPPRRSRRSSRSAARRRAYAMMRRASPPPARGSNRSRSRISTRRRNAQGRRTPSRQPLRRRQSTPITRADGDAIDHRQRQRDLDLPACSGSLERRTRRPRRSSLDLGLVQRAQDLRAAASEVRPGQGIRAAVRHSDRKRHRRAAGEREDHLRPARSPRRARTSAGRICRSSPATTTATRRVNITHHLIEEFDAKKPHARPHQGQGQHAAALGRDRSVYFNALVRPSRSIRRRVVPEAHRPGHRHRVQPRRADTASRQVGDARSTTSELTGRARRRR